MIFKKHNIISYSVRSLLSLGLIPFYEKISFKVEVSEDKITIFSGLLNKSIVDISTSKIESINIYQSLLGRILDYGNIIIIGNGGTKEELTDIASPLVFKYMVYNTVSQSQKERK